MTLTLRKIQGKQGGWIFGPLADPVVFLTGPLAAAIYLAAAPLLHEGAKRGLEALVLVVGIVVLDRAHTFATFLRVFGSSEERRRHGARIGFLALAMFAFFFGLHILSRDSFWTVATYLTVWHVLKQQVGLAVYAEDAAGPLHGRRERFFATLPLYLLWIGTLLSLHTRENPSLGWYGSSELVAIPGVLSPLATGMWVAGLLCYAGFVVWRWVARGVFSKASLVVWLSSLGGSLVLWTQDPGRDRVALVLALSVLHSIPYLAACWLVAQRSAVRNAWVDALRPARVPVGVAFLFITLLIGTSWQAVGFSTLEAVRIGSAGAPHSALMSLAEVIFMLPVMVHNVADAWLWKRTENADVFSPHRVDRHASPPDAREVSTHPGSLGGGLTG